MACCIAAASKFRRSSGVREIAILVDVRITIQDAKTGAPSLLILTTNLAACVCVCVRKSLPISALTLLFRLQTSRKFCSHSKFPYAAFGPLFAFHCPLFFYEKQSFTMQIVTLRRSRSQFCGR